MCYRRIGKIVYFFLKYQGTKSTYYFNFDEEVPLGFRPSKITISQTRALTSIDTVVCYNAFTSKTCNLMYGNEQYKIGLTNIVSGLNNFSVAVSTSWVTDDDFPEN